MAVSRPGQLTGGRHGLTAVEVAASQRSRLLQAMVAVVGECGYHGTRVADVVWRAGVSRKTFYELFGGKDECLVAAYDDCMQRLTAVTFTAFDAQYEWIDSLRGAITALLGELSRDPDAARLCFVEVTAAGAAAARHRDEAMLELLPLFDAPGAPPGDLGEAVKTGRVSELVETLRREIAAGRATRLPALGHELMYALSLPLLGPDLARYELERVGQTIT